MITTTQTALLAFDRPIRVFCYDQLTKDVFLRRTRLSRDMTTFTSRLPADNTNETLSPSRLYQICKRRASHDESMYSSLSDF